MQIRKRLPFSHGLIEKAGKTKPVARLEKKRDRMQVPVELLLSRFTYIRKRSKISTIALLLLDA